MKVEFQYKSLTESLRLLRSTYEEQQTYLPNFVMVRDETIAIFEDAFLLLPQIIEAELVDKKSTASIVRCFNLMGMALRNNETSDLESFKNHKIWQRVRNLADQALDDMKESKGKPDLSHIAWSD